MMLNFKSIFLKLLNRKTLVRCAKTEFNFLILYLNIQFTLEFCYTCFRILKCFTDFPKKQPKRKISFEFLRDPCFAKPEFIFLNFGLNCSIRWLPEFLGCFCTIPEKGTVNTKFQSILLKYLKTASTIFSSFYRNVMMMALGSDWAYLQLTAED